MEPMNSTPSLNNRLGERIPRAYAMSGHPIREASSPDAIAPLIHQSNQRRPTILVVDDRAINREFLVSLLTCAGYQTVEASSPTELPQVAQLDLIITDVHMPGMNGLDFLRALRVDSITSQVPVILNTAAYKTPAIEATAKNMGAFAVLTKPTAPEIILEQVRAALGSKAGGTTPLGFSIEGTSGEFRPARRSPVQLGYRSATLIEIMLDLAGERDPDHLLRLFCYGAKELIGVQAASAHLVASAESRGHLMFSTSAGPHSSGPQFLSDCDCGLIALTKQAKGRCLRGGGERGFQKPIDGQRFLDTVRRALGQLTAAQGT